VPIGAVKSGDQDEPARRQQTEIRMRSQSGGYTCRLREFRWVLLADLAEEIRVLLSQDAVAQTRDEEPATASALDALSKSDILAEFRLVRKSKRSVFSSGIGARRTSTATSKNTSASPQPSTEPQWSA